MIVKRRRNLRFLGHVMQCQQTKSNCMTRRLDGSRGRGRPIIKFLDSLAKAVGGGTRPVELLQMTSRRENWRSLVAYVLGNTAPRYGKVGIKTYKTAWCIYAPRLTPPVGVEATGFSSPLMEIYPSCISEHTYYQRAISVITIAMSSLTCGV